MPSLYGTGTSYTVTASNVITLYKVSTSSAVITATTYSTNLVGLYGGYWSPDPITQFVNTIVAGPGISVNTSSGNVTVSNTGVLSLRAGTNTNVSSTTGNITVWATIPNAVNTLTAGPGISVSTSSGNVVITNTGVLSLIAGTNTNVSSTTGNITIWTTPVATGVTSLTAGTGISVSTSTGSVTVTNVGVTGLIAGTNTNVSSTTGNITIWSNAVPNGVTSITAGTGISVSTSTGSVVVTNVGVTGLIAGTNTNISSTSGNITIWTNGGGSSGVSSITASTGIGVSTSTGSVTITNLGVTNLTGTAALGVSNNTGSITLTNLGVTSLTAGTNTNISASTGSITIWTNPVATGVTSITASTGIAVSTSTGSVTITNVGVTNLTGTAALGVSASTGSITLTNLGVTALAGGTAITVSNSTGSVTINNAGVTGLIAGTNTNISSTSGNVTIWTTPVATGVTSITAGSGISVSTSTGSVTVTNVGVTSLTGTAALGVSDSTGSITLTNLGVTSITAGTGTYISASTGSVTIWNDGVTPFDISTWTNQRLFTTSSVQFSGMYLTTGTQITQAVSAGGYPLTGNGQALIEQNGSSTPTLVVSNYTSSTRASVHVLMYGQNVPGGTSTTNASASIILEASRGTGTAPTAIVSGDTMGILNFNAYDGSIWPGQTGSGASSGWSAASIFSTAAETFANNGTTTTNAGSRFFFRVQPSGAWANATSRQNFLLTSWTAGNTATTSAPQLNLIIGSADGTTPTLTPSSGFGSFGVGYGATNFQLINVRTSITGVVSADSAPDNASLPNTQFITFYGNRGSGVAGRRQLLAAGDAVSGLSNFAQTVPNGSGNGLSVGTLSWTMLEASTSTAVGSRVTISTANSGTTTVQTRLQLSNLDQLYRSDLHTFYNAAGGAARLTLNTTANTNVYNSDTHNFNNTAGTAVLTLVTGTNTYNNNTHNFNITGGGTSIVQFNTSTGVALKGYSETVTTAAYTATFAPLVSTATIFKMTLTGNITFNAFTLPQAGQSAVFFFTQDATGGRLLTSSMKFSNASKTLSTAGTSTDMISVMYDGSTYYASLVKGFA